MDCHDEARTLRRRVTSIQEDLAAVLDGTRSSSTTLVCQTAAITAYPTVAQAYYGVVPVRITGKVAEGLAPTLTPGPTPFLALNVGTTVPPPGTTVVVTGTSGRWTFRYSG